jgi:hypothetical protein
VLTYDDVELPEGRIADRLRAEQYRRFRGETWLEDLLAGGGFSTPLAAASAPLGAPISGGPGRPREATR